MSTGFPVPPAVAGTASRDLFAAVDMGTNSFKLTVIRTDPSSGRFLTLNRLKEQVMLGLDTNSTVSPESLDRAITAVQKFNNFLSLQRIPSSRIRLVATSAVREASNKSQFTSAVQDALGLHVDIISGAEEARLVYLGVLQFFPFFASTVLTIDIGGGSTEFTVGVMGNVLFSKSLRLGHITLTQEISDVAKMREHIRNELQNSGLVEKINEFKLDAVIGSSGTIKAIEKAICSGYSLKENIGPVEEHVRREWRFTRDELRCLVDTLCDEDGEMEGKVKRAGFFKSRAAFIIAGAVLLNEIFELLAIETMEVSGYALGEGVITELLGNSLEGFDFKVNARWRSVLRLASRFNNKKRMKAAAACLAVAREIFGGLRRSNEFYKDTGHEEGILAMWDDRNLEYLDAACLLHNIGLYAGKKGYHKQSYHLIMNGDHLHGYSEEETKIIATLVRCHRKKLPKSEVLEGFAEEAKRKIRFLCTILRVSCAVQRCLPVNFQLMDFSHSPEGFKLVLYEGDARNLSLETAQPAAGDINVLMKKELEQFRMVFKQNLHILVSSTVS